MRYYHPTVTTYSTTEAPENKSPLEWRPSLEKGEETHVRDCMTWHGPSPRYTYRNHNYRLYTHDGRDYWTSRDCGNPTCRSCLGDDIMVARDTGYVRRNELGRTLDRGFSSKPRRLRMQEETGDYGDGSWTQRFDPMPDTARGGNTMRDPFNRPIGGDNAPRYDSDINYRSGGGQCSGRGCSGCKGDCSGSSCKDGSCGTKKSCCSGGNCGSKGPSYNGYNGYNSGGYNGGSNDLNSYRSTFPRIDEKDPGSISYRGPMGGGAGQAAIGYNRPTEDYNERPFGGGATYRSPPPPQQMQPNFDSGYQGGTSMNGMNGNGMNGGFGSGGGGGGGGAARGNDAPFRLKDDPSSSPAKPAGPRRELKGPNTAVAFTV